jgi:hypothetical protein
MWFVPHITQSPGWETTIQLENGSAGELHFSFQLFESEENAPPSIAVAPLAMVELPLRSASSGWAFADGEQATVRLCYRQVPGGGRAEFVLSDQLSSKFRLAFPVAEAGTWRGLAFANPQGCSQPFLLAAYDASGNLLGQVQRRLQKRQRWVGLLQNLFQEADAIRSLVVSSPLPASGLMVSGMASGQLLFAPADLARDEGDRELQAFVTQWFADYNQGQSLSYLASEPTLFEAGDPERPLTSPHRYLSNLPYGPYPRNVLDLWLPRNGLPRNAQAPNPLVLFIHGGGFVSGDKSALSTAVLDKLLGSGFAVASINYRWAVLDPRIAVEMETPNGEGSEHNINGARLDYILRDCARAVQFLRYKAEQFALDGARIGSHGGSAGGGASLWIATLPDLAQPQHPDPVLRESSRIQAVGHLNSQVSYYWNQWPERLGFSSETVLAMVQDDIRLTQMEREEQNYTAAGRDLGRILDYYQHLSPMDPPLYTENNNPDLAEPELSNGSQVIHHPRGHLALYLRASALGVDAWIRTQTLTTTQEQITDFFLRVL